MKYLWIMDTSVRSDMAFCLEGEWDYRHNHAIQEQILYNNQWLAVHKRISSPFSNWSKPVCRFQPGGTITIAAFTLITKGSFDDIQ